MADKQEKSETDFFNQQDRVMLRDLHALISGSIADGKHRRGLADMVLDHQEVLHGRGDADKGLVGREEENRRQWIKATGIAVGFSIALSMVKDLILPKK